MILRQVSLLTLMFAAALWTAGCAVDPRATAPRPALEMPNHIAAMLAVPSPVVERDLVRIGHDGDLEFWRGRLDAGPLDLDTRESMSFRLVIPENGTGKFVLALPILAGGAEIMWWVATDLAKRGFTVAWPDRVASTLKPGQRGPELERIFTRSAVHARMLLAWARQEESLTADDAYLVGISLGSMVGAAVLAAEPRVHGALCLAGGDLPDMILKSDERRARRWRQWRQNEDATPRSEILRELDQDLRTDPALLAGFVDTDRVLLVAARLDDIVPPRHQDLLYEALGRPERVRWPLGHISAALALPLVLNDVADFFDRHSTNGSGAAAPR